MYCFWRFYSSVVRGLLLTTVPYTENTGETDFPEGLGKNGSPSHIPFWGFIKHCSDAGDVFKWYHYV